MDEYIAEWRKIREVIDAKMRADLRPAFVEDVPVKPQKAGWFQYVEDPKIETPPIIFGEAIW